MGQQPENQLSLFNQDPGLHTSRPGVVNRYINQLRATTGEAFHRVVSALQNDRKARMQEVRDIASGLGTQAHNDRKEAVIDRLAKAGAQPSREYDPDIRYQQHLHRREAMGLPQPTGGPMPDPCRDTVVRVQDFQRERGPRR